MSERQFDAVRASFYLVAIVIVAHVAAALMGEFACLWHAEQLISGTFKCDTEGKLMELLASSLAAALAFAGGRYTHSRDVKPDDKEPDE
jgi:hypothetical protein